MSNILQIVSLLKQSNRTVVLTGAGMSTESGVPDFRSSKGIWQQIDPLQVATVDALENDYDTFHRFYTMRLQQLAQCKPHAGHIALAQLEKQGIISFVATQNVDGFHTTAGSTHVAELHGNIHDIRCHSCHQPHTVQQFIAKVRCTCGGLLRPGVVLFGEYLPEEAWIRTSREIEQADAVIVIGTSLQVSPVNQLPSMTRGKKIYINAEISPNAIFDVMIEGSAKENILALQNVLI